MMVKGRGVRLVGEQKGTAKLSEREVLEIRALHRQDWPGKRVVAKRFGVSATTIKTIVMGETWKHLQ